jgi:arginine/lysine/ornithine decarboxylase
MARVSSPAQAGAVPTPSPIVRVLNEEVRHYHRWCTPSTLMDQERIEDFYASDVSISAGFFGTLVDHTGVFGEAERFAASAQGADRTMFSVHGSSGSNWIVLRMLALERPDALVLVARNIHHSIINALKAFGLDFRFLPTPYDAEFEAVLPPSVDEVVAALRRYPEALAVIYTSPTYEGLCANTHAIATAVHDASPHTILFVDEAWGGHLHFHPELPPSAMDAGADLAVQSTHKLAGGLQQTGLIHWREGRVDSELMEEAFREYVTTSPSYHLLASADASVRALAANGTEALGACIARTRELKAALRERLPRLVHLDDPGWTGRHWSHVARTDLVKTTVALSAYDVSGFAVSQSLVERGIVIEKAGINTLTFITTFQLEAAAVEDTVRALEEVLAGRELAEGASRPIASNPFSAFDDRPVMHPYHARRYAKSVGHEVAIEDAIGRVAAEIVEVYPPGIPVILEGFRVSADAVRYLCEVRDMGGAIVARDTSLQTLRVL